MFQFLMVQLKEVYDVMNRIAVSGFQFLMVQLKDPLL